MRVVLIIDGRRGNVQELLDNDTDVHGSFLAPFF